MTLLSQLSNCCDFVKSVSFSYLDLAKKPITFRNMSRQFSIIISKYVHFWTLVLKTILKRIKFLFQQYISCRSLNFDPTYKNEYHGDFPLFWKSGIWGLVDHFVACTKMFLEVSLGSRCFSGLKHFYGTLLQGLD